jgi:hypothetical protein
MPQGDFEKLTQPLRDIFNLFEEFASSVGGGFVLSLASAAKAEEVWEAFVAGLDEDKKAIAGELARTIGIGGPTRQVRSDLGFGPEEIAWIQERIDSGQAVNEDWYNQLTEDVPNPFKNAIEGAFDLAAQGEELGAEFFDPEGSVARFREATGPVVEGLEALPGQVASANEDLQRFFGSLRGDFQTGAADINAGFQDIFGTATGLVENLGVAERQDINRRFDEAGGEQAQRLSQRGFGGTILSSVASGFERERSTALLTLEEQIAEQQLGVQETFGLGALSAQERLLAGDINLGAMQGSAQQFGNQLFANTAFNSLAAQGNIAAGEFGAFDQAAVNRLNSLGFFGQIPGQTQLSATDLLLQFYGQQPVVAPGSGQQPPIQVQLPVR